MTEQDDEGIEGGKLKGQLEAEWVGDGGGVVLPAPVLTAQESPCPECEAGNGHDEEGGPDGQKGFMTHGEAEDGNAGEHHRAGEHDRRCEAVGKLGTFPALAAAGEGGCGA